MPAIDSQLEERLRRLCLALVDQQNARVIVPPMRNGPGCWFGGGNMIQAGDGSLYLVGRYRNSGDSRLGVGAGERGLELAIFRSDDCGHSFQKAVSYSKPDLTVGNREVLSIEGSALHWTDRGVELFVSTEKTNIGYPDGWEQYLKPGTGVWTIERLEATSVDGLQEASVRTVLESTDLRYLHIKDPFLYDLDGGDVMLLFCSHPFCWTSSNTGYARKRKGDGAFGAPVFDFFPRGCTWDVAITRGTSVVDVPRTGAFRDRPVSLVFYDGGESIRNLEQHTASVTRPRGYSCEELGGAAYVVGGDFHDTHRISKHLPLFTSPWGTGCSRYVDVLSTDEGMFATWQQSRNDGSQPLVLNFLSRERIDELLA